MLCQYDSFHLSSQMGEWLRVAARMHQQGCYECWPDGRILVEAERLIDLIEELGQKPSFTTLLPWYACGGLRPVEISYPCTRAGEPLGVQCLRRQGWQAAAGTLIARAVSERWSVVELLAGARLLIVELREEFVGDPQQDRWYVLGANDRVTLSHASPSGVKYRSLDNYPLKHDRPGYRWT